MEKRIKLLKDIKDAQEKLSNFDNKFPRIVETTSYNFSFCDLNKIATMHTFGCLIKKQHLTKNKNCLTN